MQPYQKILGLIIALAMIFLSACSAVQRQPATVTPAATATVTLLPSPTATPRAIITPQAAIPVGVQLTLWYPWTGAQADWLETTTDAFNRTNQWGITVTLEMHGDDSVLMDDVAQADGNSALPNVVVAPGDFLELWSQSGLPVLDLNTYIDSSEVGWSQVQTGSFLPIMWKSDLVGDRRLGLPALRTGNFLFYNRTWAEKLGFKAEPQNIQDFQEQTCAAGKANMSDGTTKNNGTGGWVYTTQGLPMLSWLKAFAGDDFTKDDTLHFQADGTQTALEYLFDLYNNDCAWSGKESSPYQYFSSRYALFYSGDSRDILTQEQYNQDAKSADQWTLLPYPTDQNRPVVFVNGYSYAIFGKDDDQNTAAWLYLRYLMETDNQVRLVEATGTLPVSNAVISALTDFRSAHPVWNQALEYLALAQVVPGDPSWTRAEDISSDMAWQLKFLASKDSIPGLLSEADSILQEGNNE